MSLELFPVLRVRGGRWPFAALLILLGAAVAATAEPPDAPARAGKLDTPPLTEAVITPGQKPAPARAGCGWAPGHMVGSPDGPVYALRSYLPWENHDPRLAVGGEFTTVDGTLFDNIALWNGSEWWPLGSGLEPGTDGPVYTIGLSYTLETQDPCLGGSFSTALGYEVHNLFFRWGDCGSEGTDAPVWAIAQTPFYGWPYYIGGEFLTGGGVAANYIAECDFDWGPLGLGTDWPVYAIDNEWPDVYVGGAFYWAGDVLASGIARWDGSLWSTLDGPSGTGTDNSVFTLTRYDGNVYAGGAFNQAGGIAANHIARWDGTRWWPLEGPSGNGTDSWVRTMTYDGQYVGGWFITAGGVTVNHIARWTSQWSALDSPFGVGTDGPVYAVQWYDDGSGPALYAGGNFTHAGGLYSPYLAKWVCESVPPSNPTQLISTSHQPGRWSNEPVVDVSWSGATDSGGSGLAAYSFLFDNSPSTLPDTTPELFHSADPHTTSSGVLADGSHWFHLLAMDGAGNRAGGRNLGPFQIDATPPSAVVLSSSSHTPGVANEDPTVDVSWLPDPGDLSGIDGYGIEVSQASNWVCDQVQDVGEDTTSMTTAPLPAGDWYVHVCAADNAGNWTAASTIGPFVILPGWIFVDDFESGSTSAWSAVVP